MAVEGDTVFVLMQDPYGERHWIVLGVYATRDSAEKVIALLMRASVSGDLKIEECELRA